MCSHQVLKIFSLGSPNISQVPKVFSKMFPMSPHFLSHVVGPWFNLYIQIVCLLLKLNAPTTIIITPTYSLKVLLNSRHKTPPILLLPGDLHMFRLMVKVHLMLYNIGNAHTWSNLAKIINII